MRHPVPRRAETAPEHRHSQNAFRFVVEGEGVWTVVNGDPVAMRRGDLLLTPGWNFHGHHNDTDQPMAWIDGLDVPFANYTDVGFFEYGAERVTDEASPAVSRSERLWAHPGLRPLSVLEDKVSSRCRRIAGSTPTPRSASSSPSRTRDTRQPLSRACGHPVHQPDDWRRRDADHPVRVPPAAGRARRAGA